MSDNKETGLIKLSASSLKTYEQCPRKYHFCYIQKIPQQPKDYFDLGNICHKTLELFHQEYMKNGSNKNSLSKLMGDSFAEARKGFQNVPDKILEEAKSLLMDYLEKVKNKGMPVVKGVEIKFDLKLRDDILLRGFLDRMDLTKDGKFKIVDYKTTKDPKYLDDFQLLVYGIYLKENYPDIDGFKAEYVLLKHKSKTKEYTFNLEDIDRVKKEVIDYADRIKNEKEWTPVPTKLCDYCDYKSLCPSQTKESW